MANIECKDCGDLVGVEARTVTLPFVCKWCEEGFTYTTPRYIIQYEGCDGWIRSENTDARGVFDDFSVASAVAAAETDNGDGLVYRVVPYDTPDEYSETGGEYPDLFRKPLDGATTKDVKIKSLENSLDYYKKSYNRWERLWS